MKFVSLVVFKIMKLFSLMILFPVSNGERNVSKFCLIFCFHYSLSVNSCWTFSCDPPTSTLFFLLCLLHRSSLCPLLKSLSFLFFNRPSLFVLWANLSLISSAKCQNKNWLLLTCLFYFKKEVNHLSHLCFALFFFFFGPLQVRATPFVWWSWAMIACRRTQFTKTSIRNGTRFLLCEWLLNT